MSSLIALRPRASATAWPVSCENIPPPSIRQAQIPSRSAEGARSLSVSGGEGCGLRLRRTAYMRVNTWVPHRDRARCPELVPALRHKFIHEIVPQPSGRGKRPVADFSPASSQGRVIFALIFIHPFFVISGSTQVESGPMAGSKKRSRNTRMPTFPWFCLYD